MLRSKAITDYIEVSLSQFRAGTQAPVDLHLYFNRNSHVLIWRKQGETITESFIAKYRSRGIDSVWIHRADESSWESYRASLDPDAVRAQAPVARPAGEPVAAAVTAAFETSLPAPVLEALTAIVDSGPPVFEAAPEPTAPAPAPAPDDGGLAPFETRTEAGQAIHDLLQATSLTDRERSALIAVTARGVLQENGDARSSGMRDTIRDVLDVVLASSSNQARGFANEVWDLASAVPEMSHAVNVATYAMLFAMAFGRIDQPLLADIGLAGLLHDIGISQIPADLAPVPRIKHLYAHRQQFAAHVDETLALLNAYAKHIPPRIRAIINQHHEKFGGGGYPQDLQGFQIDDVAQLLVLADTLDSVASGRWDGKSRTLGEALDQLELLQRQGTSPEWFNPDVFATVLRWMRDERVEERAKNAASAVRAKAKALVDTRSRGGVQVA